MKNIREQKRREIESLVSSIFDGEFYERSGLYTGMAIDGVDAIETRYVHGCITLDEARDEMEEIREGYIEAEEQHEKENID